MKHLIAVAAASVLALAGCIYEYDCPQTARIRTVKGEVVLTQSKEGYAEFVAWRDSHSDDRSADAGSPAASPWPRRISRIAGATYGSVALDDACPSAAWGCMRFGPTSADGFTFRRPADAGTFTLRELGAKSCESVEYPSSAGPRKGSLRCSEVDGQLVVRAVVAPCPSPGDLEGSACARLDADLTIEARADDAPGPLVSGSARIDVHEETVDRVCTGGGIGRVPGFGPE